VDVRRLLRSLEYLPADFMQPNRKSVPREDLVRGAEEGEPKGEEVNKPPTIEQLIEAGACETGLAFAREHLPNAGDDWQVRLVGLNPSCEAWLVRNRLAQPITSGSVAGHFGIATAGHFGNATAGDYGTATAGVGGTATAGCRGNATAGVGGTATAGDGGNATAGVGGTIQIRYWDERYRVKTGYIGEDGLEPNTPYRLNAKHEFEAVK
jgi:hypothetical protein